jgi:predicted RNase H-like HicB family nuclease
MKPTNRYLKFVQWSDADNAFVGFCPDLFPYGGVCHGDTEPGTFAALCHIVEETVSDASSEGLPLPECRTRPMQEVVPA